MGVVLATARVPVSKVTPPYYGLSASLAQTYTCVMNVHIAETTVDSKGRVVLDHLPFRPGDRVDVIVRSHGGVSRDAMDLRGSVLRYENPFEPVALEDWEIRS